MDDQTTPTPQQPAVENNIETKPVKKIFFNKKVLIIVGVIALILIPIFLLVVVNKNSEDNVVNLPPDEPENVLLATVDGEEIRRSDVRLIASEQILGSGIDGNALRTYLPMAIERKILDREASISGITVPENDNKVIYYENLKKEIIRGQVTEITAYDITWWIPPAPDYDQRPEFETQRSEGALAAEEIASSLREGSTPIEIVPQIVEKYPSLEGIIGINGGQYSSAEDLSSFNSPRVHQYDSENLYLPFYDALYSMLPGQVTSNVWENGSGAAIIQVTEVKRGEAVNYSEWLSIKESELVTLYQENIDKL